MKKPARGGAYSLIYVGGGFAEAFKRFYAAFPLHR
jgi:hypothetical protein